MSSYKYNSQDQAYNLTRKAYESGFNCTVTVYPNRIEYTENKNHNSLTIPIKNIVSVGYREYHEDEDFAFIFGGHGDYSSFYAVAIQLIDSSNKTFYFIQKNHAENLKKEIENLILNSGE